MMNCPPELKNYPGAKEGSGIYQTIINELPPHKVYIEPFLGSGTILRYKKLANRTVGIDYSGSVINAWQKMSMPAGIELYHECSLTYLDNLTANSNSMAGKDKLIYVDPPYPINSRSYKGKLYDCELTDKQHERLLHALLHLSLFGYHIVISTYANKLYRSMLQDWRCIAFNSQTRKGKSVELLYLNYDKPKQLHDYRYLGIDMTDRQRIKRKIERKVKDWQNLPVLERQALIESLIKNGLI